MALVNTAFSVWRGERWRREKRRQYMTKSRFGGNAFSVFFFHSGALSHLPSPPSQCEGHSTRMLTKKQEKTVQIFVANQW